MADLDTSGGAAAADEAAAARTSRIFVIEPTSIGGPARDGRRRRCGQRDTREGTHGGAKRSDA